MESYGVVSKRPLEYPKFKQVTVSSFSFIFPLKNCNFPRKPALAKIPPAVDLHHLGTSTTSSQGIEGKENHLFLGFVADRYPTNQQTGCLKLVSSGCKPNVPMKKLPYRHPPFSDIPK